MRFALLLSASLLICLSGCSIFVAGTGTRLDALKNCEQVHQKFGEPIQTDQSGSESTEEYFTHRKISDPHSNGIGMGIAMTAGLGELIAFPYYSWRECRHIIIGQHLQFKYDVMGNVISVYRDGEHAAGQYVPVESVDKK